MTSFTKRFVCALPNAKPRFSDRQNSPQRTYSPEARANDKSQMTNDRTIRPICHLEFVICHLDEPQASSPFVTFVPLPFCLLR
jgi:hypothetical protein